MAPSKAVMLFQGAHRYKQWSKCLVSYKMESEQWYEEGLSVQFPHDVKKS